MGRPVWRTSHMNSPEGFFFEEDVAPVGRDDEVAGAVASSRFGT